MKTVWLIAVSVGFLVAVYSLRAERRREENIISLVAVRSVLVVVYRGTYESEG